MLVPATATPSLETLVASLENVVPPRLPTPEKNAPERLRTITPASVMPPGTGVRWPANPHNRIPPLRRQTETVIGPRLVGTPEMQKLPFTAVVVESARPGMFTTTPLTGVPFVDCTIPHTVVVNS